MLRYKSLYLAFPLVCFRSLLRVSTDFCGQIRAEVCGGGWNGQKGEKGFTPKKKKRMGKQVSNFLLNENIFLRLTIPVHLFFSQHLSVSVTYPRPFLLEI